MRLALDGGVNKILIHIQSSRGFYVLRGVISVAGFCNIRNRGSKSPAEHTAVAESYAPVRGRGRAAGCQAAKGSLDGNRNCGSGNKVAAAVLDYDFGINIFIEKGNGLRPHSNVAYAHTRARGHRRRRHNR